MLVNFQSFVVLVLISLLTACASSPEPGSQPTRSSGGPSEDAFLGRWDVTVKSPSTQYPSWFELSKEDGQLKGRLVGRFGSARPIATVRATGGELVLSLPKQYEKRSDDLSFKGRLVGDRLEGSTTAEDGSPLSWVAVRAPDLTRQGTPEWGDSISLFNERNLEGWRPRDPGEPNGWSVKNGALVNATPSCDLITEKTFNDFKLHLEFKVPEKGNSGIYLRGRYEVQIDDSLGKEPDSHALGGVYGFLTPTSIPARKAGEWQTYDITLIGRRVTVVLNGTTVLDDAEIPGITGGALDSEEGAPGPIFLQGDHTAVSYRNIVITPAKQTP
ncbi:MAG: DUF1080 domain-containing protein [Acidobacteriota bacterium]